VRHYLDNEPVLACPPSAWYRFSKFARRNRGALLAAALVLLALVTGTVVSVWQALRATAAMNSEQQALLNLEGELERTKQAEEKATRELFESLVAQARANRLSRRTGQRFGTLEIIRRATALARQLDLPQERFLELRNEAIAAMALPDLRVAKEWVTPGGFWLVFDPKLERYARTDLKGTVYVRRAGDGAEICRLTGYAPVELGYVFSPNGEYLAIADFSRRLLDVWQLTGNVPTRVLSKQTLGRWPQFSPDSREIAAQLLDGRFCFFDLSTQDAVRHLPPVPQGSCIAFKPDGTQIAISGAGGTQVHELLSGKLRWQNRQAGESPEWHPDGKTVAVYSKDAICLWDADDGKPVGRLDGITGGGVTFAFNPTGALLVSRGWSDIVRLWDPRNCRQIFSVPAFEHLLRFSPEGRLLAARENGDQVGVWEVAAGDEYRTLTANPLNGKRRYSHLAVNFDGRLLAAGGSGGTVSVWDLPSGKELAFHEESSANWNCYVGFDPRPARAYETEKIEETLLTRGGNGFFRRSIRIDSASGAVKVGSAQKLPVSGKSYRFVLSQDGKFLAAAESNGAVVWQTEQPQKLFELRGHQDVRTVAISPDGQWVLTGRFSHPHGIKIWQARAGKFEFVRDLPGNQFRAAFSPDGKRILTTGGSEAHVIRRWEVGSWVELPFPVPIAGHEPVFSPDGKFVVLETRLGIAQLIDAETGREYARFEDPNQDRASDFAFTPDGTKLVCATEDGFCVHVWNLQAIRRQLTEMGLDW